MAEPHGFLGLGRVMHACALNYIGRDSNRDEPGTRSVTVMGYSDSMRRRRNVIKVTTAEAH
jgi:hypothetical protein